MNIRYWSYTDYIIIPFQLMLLKRNEISLIKSYYSS